MLDAQKHPELHRNLVVRIWGWSAYFVELDKEFRTMSLQGRPISYDRHDF